MTWLLQSAPHRSKISGEFGSALNEYVEDLRKGCQRRLRGVKSPIIDVINSWHDQVFWRSKTWTGYRDDAKAGNLTVRDDRYIQAPDSVPDPGDLPKSARKPGHAKN